MCIHTEALKGLENKNMPLDIGVSEHRGRGLTGQFRPTLMGLCWTNGPESILPYCIICFIGLFIFCQ